MISISGLVKTFGSTRALDGLDLVVDTGEVHGFLGPNGSGKTTTIRVLLGLLRADGGEVTLLGGDPWRDAVALHRRLAYVPGDVTLWPKLSGGEVIDLLGRLRGDLDPGRRDELLERFELDPTKKARTYSKGNRQKVGLVAALASSAELLVLDEPTSGLDPLMEAVFQDCIREVKAEGRTVLLSSHILAEVEALCDRVSIIRAGRTQQSGTLQEFQRMTRTSIVAEVAQSRRRACRACRASTASRSTVHRVRFDVDTVHLDEAVRRLGELGVRSLVSHPPTLEELFLRHYGDELAHEAELADRLRRRRAVTTTEASFAGHRAAHAVRVAPRPGAHRRVGRPRSCWSSCRPSRASRASTRTRPSSTKAARGIGGQRRRRSSSTDRRRASTPWAAGRLPDRDLRADPDGPHERLHARPADPGRRGGRAAPSCCVRCPSGRTRSPARGDDHASRP